MFTLNISFLVLCHVFLYFSHASSVQHFERDITIHKRSIEKHTTKVKGTIHKRAATENSNSCPNSATYQNNLKPHLNVHFFHNDTNPSISLTWSGNNGVLIALTTLSQGFVTRPSRLYRSDNRGKVFHDISSRINGAYIRKSNGIQVSPVDTNHIILLGYISPFESLFTNTIVYITNDAAETFEKTTLPFAIDDKTIKYNTKNKYRLTALSLNHELWISKDFARSWEKVATFVPSAKWDPLNQDVLYFTMDPLHTLNRGSMENELYRYNVASSKSTLLAQHVHSFAIQNNFLFLSTQFSGKNGSRVMHVSKDQGTTWSAAQLPMINRKQFYSMLDMTEDMVFVHVDVEGDTGHGSIYTSDERGVIYSLSLERHLYPNTEGVTDFYKVQSLAGVYITSQLANDNTVHSLITFDKGGTWQPITRPDGAVCKSTEKVCHLQIHNSFSSTKGVRLPSLPLSSENTVGLILAHGNLGDGLSFNSPSVFVSRDGGYKWTAPKELDGPHFYGIGDTGGILFAVPSTTETINTIFFSFDEGACWHSFQFSKNKIMVTGISAEPGQKATDISIWGWDREGDGSWLAVTIDFEAALGRDCANEDYSTWVAHETNSLASLAESCLLGAKKTFIRRKKGSVCVNKDKLVPSPTVVPCQCQTTDFLCDYGYKRASDGKCVEDSSFATSRRDICIAETEEEITTQGYRKIPGDKCNGGFDPPRMIKSLHKSCAKAEVAMEESGVDQREFEAITTSPPHNSPHTGVIIVLVLAVLGLGAALVFILYRKRFSKLKVRYTPLSTIEESPTHGNGSLVGTTTVMTDDDIDTPILVEANETTKPNGNAAKISYHDDSDEDLLVS